MKSAKQVMAEAVPEKDWLQSIIDEARLKGWMVYHSFDSRRSEAGFPDLVAVKGNRLLFIEAKSEKGRLTDAQRRWRSALNRVETVDAYMVRPSDAALLSELLSGAVDAPS